jgi:hypothetical protein
MGEFRRLLTLIPISVPPAENNNLSARISDCRTTQSGRKPRLLLPQSDPLNRAIPRLGVCDSKASYSKHFSNVPSLKAEVWGCSSMETLCGIGSNFRLITLGSTWMVLTGFPHIAELGYNYKLRPISK